MGKSPRSATRTKAFFLTVASPLLAEFLVHDTANERGFLHIWFCPGAKAHPQLAEAFITSIRPAPLPLKNLPEPPACP